MLYIFVSKNNLCYNRDFDSDLMYTCFYKQKFYSIWNLLTLKYSMNYLLFYKLSYDVKSVNICITFICTTIIVKLLQVNLSVC